MTSLFVKRAVAGTQSPTITPAIVACAPLFRMATQSGIPAST